ncbi:aminopeptidase P family protein [Cetobacterium sp. SF1]|uniref:aminopeptidase P family protein n=1 Tax=Cetobacterium sp. SF1 TaxID=3417654 RepID=UPI003CF3FBAD
MTANEKIYKIRELMKKNSIGAIIIPSGDPHMSEYIPEFWKTRRYVSGFTGSAGTLVILENESGLWTDGRYYSQCEKELNGSEIKLFKAMEKDCPTYGEYLGKKLPENGRVGINGKIFSIELVEKLKKEFQEKNLTLVENIDYGNDIWHERPEEKINEIFVLEEKFTGKSSREKIKKLREELEKKKLDSIVLGKLDNIAWLFNIRGRDVPNNPVVISYGYVDGEKSILFVDKRKVSSEVQEELADNGIQLKSYENIFEYCKGISGNVSCDKKEINYSLYKVLEENKNIAISFEENPIVLMKACKNPVEIRNIEKAYLKDACAQSEFYGWLDEKMENNSSVTEYDCVEKLKYFRSKQENYFEESFNGILAYGPNAAMMHYSPKKNNSALLEKRKFLLNDSGGQYFEGTTDTTRTYALGKTSEEEKHDYTLVLKGVISLSQVVFKEGTSAGELDILCRQFFWNEGLDYRCGTGHGIGFMLNVHENPPSFKDKITKLMEGMCITIEPGVYKENSHGIRIENTVVVTEAMETEYGKFFKFKNFTLLPIDIESLDIGMLSKNEIDWINNYHEIIFEKVYPKLSETGKKWLREKAKKI